MNMKFMNLILKYAARPVIVTLIFCFLCIGVQEQRDSTKRQTIEITSSYKPVLRNTVKINLYASPITADTTRHRLAYNIPPQNLFFSYQPVSLNPIALS